MQGFHSLNGDYERDILIALSQKDIEKSVGRIALASLVSIAVGYIEKEEGNIFSSYLICDREGRGIYNYRRISKGWKEQRWDSRYKEGESFGSFRINGKKFMAALCGDLWADDEP